MKKTLLNKEIAEWATQQDYWLQYISFIILEAVPITPEISSQILQYFLEDHELAPTVAERSQIEFSTIEDAPIESGERHWIKELRDVRNVNALAADQVIQFHPNLTLIYGGNGTGKSGYIRLLNNAFNSRGDKTILPNIFKSQGSSQTYAKVVFANNEEELQREYPAEGRDARFQQFSVFDSLSVLAHLSKDNTLNFTPHGFEFFELLLDRINDVKSALTARIESRKRSNEYLSLFQNTNEFQSAIANLSSDSNAETLSALFNFSNEDSEELDRLSKEREELKALDIPERIKHLQSAIASLEELRSNYLLNTGEMTADRLAIDRSLINDYRSLEELATSEGLSSLQNYKIEAIGSPEWRKFIASARSYVSILEETRTEGHYPQTTDHCIFCLQPIGIDQVTLIESYWELLKSKAQSDTKIKLGAITDRIATIQNLPTLQIIADSVIRPLLDELEPTFLSDLLDSIASLEECKEQLLKNLEVREWLHELEIQSIPLTPIESLINQLRDQITQLGIKNPHEEIKKKEEQILYLKDKELGWRLRSKILSYVADLKWIAKAEKAGKFNTRAITTKQGHLFESHITNTYTNLFTNECTKLNAPSIVTIEQKNSKMTTLRKLEVHGSEAHKILSEGEQRAISLADFLTEAQLNPNIHGLIFDDPVTSQDHERKECIAKRLVELAEQKQIVVFTHDISFFYRLLSNASLKKVEYSCTTIRKAGNQPGFVNPDLPWLVQPVGKRVKHLRDRLVSVRKTYVSGDTDEYFNATKTWYLLLREAWERAVEERLFKGVIERFSPAIQTQKLKNLKIDDTLIHEITVGMTECSNWLHDSAQNLNPSPPSYTVLESELNKLDSFVQKVPPH